MMTLYGRVYPIYLICQWSNEGT